MRKVGRRQAIVGGALLIGGCGKLAATEGRRNASSGGDGGTSPSPFDPFDLRTPEPPPTAACPPGPLSPVYLLERRGHQRPAASVLYSWTTQEQIDELRLGKTLFTRTERPGLGPGYAMELFASLAGTATEQQRVAALLGGDTFAKARYAWPFPWATRMGWPGESYGNQLLRIELKPEALTVTFHDGQFHAVDSANNEVPLATVLAAPERIGAIYFVKDDITGPCAGSSSGPVSTFGSFGSTCVTGVGYREFIVGNEAMVAEWSHATLAIHQRLEVDISVLRVLADRVQLHPTPDPMWNSRVVNHWRAFGSVTCYEEDAYIDSLAIPSALYEPFGGNVQAMIDTLSGDLFTLDPFVVVPGRDAG